MKHLSPLYLIIPQSLWPKEMLHVFTYLIQLLVQLCRESTRWHSNTSRNATLVNWMHLLRLQLLISSCMPITIKTPLFPERFLCFSRASASVAISLCLFIGGGWIYTNPEWQKAQRQNPFVNVHLIICLIFIKSHFVFVCFFKTPNGLNCIYPQSITVQL